MHSLTTNSYSICEQLGRATAVLLSEAVDFLAVKMYNYDMAITMTGDETMGQYYDVLNLDKKELLPVEGYSELIPDFHWIK